MIPFRVIRSSVLLAGLVATFGLPLHAASGSFIATLSDEEKAATGIALLTMDETVALDRLVAEDANRVRRLNADPKAGTFVERQWAGLQEAGLDRRLAPEHLAKLNELIALSLVERPQLRERPRLKDNEVVSLKRRLEVHGGMSLTYGWAGGGRDFRSASAWVSYYDPVTGIGLGFGFSRSSGDMPFGYYPGYYGMGAYDDSFPSGYFANASRPNAFRGDGSSLRGAFGATRFVNGFRR